MGVVIKSMAFLVGLSLTGLGVGLIGIPLIVYALWGLFRRRSKHRVDGGGGNPPGSQRAIGKRAVLGSLLLVLALIGIAEGGRMSVVFFGGTGLLVFGWNLLPRPGWLTKTRPAEESILLGSTPAPLVWTAVSEVKLLTRNVASVLSALEEPVFISASGKPALYFSSRVVALSHEKAMRKMAAKLSNLASTLLPLNAYILPLDSADAAGLIHSKIAHSSFDGKNWRHAVKAEAYEFVSLRHRSGFVESIGLARKHDGSKTGHRVDLTPNRIPRPPLVLEMVKALEEKVSWPVADDVTSYLAGLGATRGEPIGARIVNGSFGQGTVLTETVPGRGVELKPSQLRALATIYQ